MADKQSSYDRIPPHNLEAEESLLGSMLLSKEVIDDIHEMVEPEDFYREANGKIFQAIMELYGHNEPVDAITLAEVLKRKNWLAEVGGKSYIHTLVNVVPTAANALHYANIVNDSSLLRRMIRAATDIAALGYTIPEDVDEAINQAEAMILEVSKKREMGSIESIGQLLSAAYEELELLSGADGSVVGTGTGFTDLDKLSGGFRSADFIVVAGRPGMGKTSFALTIAQNVALEQKKPVLLFSLEMSKVELSMRILCSEARVNARNLRNSSLKEEEWKRVASAMNRLSEAPITINDAGNITMVGIRSVARRMNNKEPLGLVIVDYMQLMTGHGRSENRQQEVSEISRAMKLLARELECPVMGISQLSRGPESRNDKRPMLSDLRESGAIEQDADQVMFIYRDEEYDPHTDDKGVAEILLRKHRHGPTGDVRLAFIGDYTRFNNLDRHHGDD
jgi:replicative DNA helicase